MKGGARQKREKLVRYVARPTFSEEQLELLDDGRVRLHLRAPTEAGQTFVTFDAVQFLRRLAWQIAPPRQNQVRYYGVLGATHKLRNAVVPRPPALTLLDESDKRTRYRVPWAQLIAKVYHVDSKICLECGGALVPVAAVTNFDQAKAEIELGILVLGETQMARAPPNAAYAA